MGATTVPRARRGWPLRILRLAGWLVLGLVLLVVLVLGLLALPPVRGAVLDFALGQAQDRLPGSVTVEAITWPKLARLELDGLLWTAADGDTLAAADRFAVHVALKPLLQRDLRVRELTVAGARADVPAIRTALAPPAGEPAPQAVPAETPVAAGLPVSDLAIDSLAIDVRARLDPERTLAADVRSSGASRFALRAATTKDGEPEVDVAGTLLWSLAPIGAALDVAGTVPGTRLDRLRLAAELPEGLGGPVDAEIEVVVPQLAVRTHGVVDLSEGVSVALAPLAVQRTGEPAPVVVGRDGAVVVRDGNVEVTGLKVEGGLGKVTANATVRSEDTGPAARVEVEFDLAGPRTLAELFVPDLPETTRFDHLGNVRGFLRGTFAQAGGANEFEVQLDLTRTDWLEDARIDVHGRDGTVEVTRLKLASELGALDGTVALRTGAAGLAADGQLEFDLAGPRALAELFVPDLPETTRFDHLGNLRGFLRGAFAQAGGANEFEVQLDLTRTDWLEDARIDAHGRDGSVEVTRLKLASELGALDGTVALRSGAAGLAAEGQLEFRLPGPRDLAAWFPSVVPESLRVDDLGDLQGSVGGSFARGEGPPEFEVRLDLTGTEWLESGRIEARGRDGNLEIDTLSVAMQGLVVEASGKLTPEIDARLRLELPDSSFIARLPAARGAGVDLALEASARGTVESPELVASLAGRAAYRETAIPALSLDLVTRGDSLDVSLDLPEGGTHAGRSVDRVDLDVTLAFPPVDLPDGRLRLEAAGEGLAVTLRTGFATGDTIAAAVDTLGLGWGKQSLASQSPFALRYDRTTGAVAIDDLDLQGPLGRIRADADWSGEEIVADLEIAIAASVDQVAKLLPEAPLPRERGLTFALEGSARARGTPEEPVIDGTGLLRLGGGPTEVDSLTVALDLHAGNDRTTGGRGLPEVRGVAGQIVVRRPQGELVRGTLIVPATVSLAPPALRPDPADTLRLSLHSQPIPLAELAPLLPPGISLAGTVQVEGDIRRPPGQEELLVEGFTELSRVRFDSDDGSWAQAGGRITLAGTSRRPRLEGTITVDGGVIVLPEAPPTLLPVEGDAILWAPGSEVEVVVAEPVEPGTDDAPEDRPEPPATEGAGASPPAATGAGADTADVADSTAFAPELAVIVDCPGSVHLRGRGLSLDLRGKLELEYRGEPVIVGELTAVRGTLGFLGRQFQVTRGIVSFYGDPETDPALDLTLEARISGATYRVSITGDAARPKLTLSSDPQMSDGDIVASILFGKPLDQLDSGQESLLQARMLAVLAQYGADSVSGDVTRALGVDMISYDEAGDRSGRSALTIGKYLNPRTLVKYEQIIDREIAYLLRLEYALTQAIKVETAFGQGTASGVDLLWSRDY